MGGEQGPDNRDWPAYFAKLREQHIREHGRELPSNIADKTPEFAGPANPVIILIPDATTGEFVCFGVGQDGTLGEPGCFGQPNQLDRYLGLQQTETYEFRTAKEVWEDHGCPEMWLFWNLQSAPWHCPAAPKPKQQKKGPRKP